MSAPVAAEPVIRITNVATAFGSQVVLAGVNLEVALGETLVVLGRSGTGKSVLLRHLIGLQPPDSGSIQVLGLELTSLPEDQLNALRRKLGFVFQNAALYDSLTVLENVAFPLQYNTALTGAERRDQGLKLLARVGMEEASGKSPTELSGGMRKRVGLARALALAPEIMLYDEPTAGLDPITSGEITELMLQLQEERAMSSVVVTHDMHNAGLIANRVAMLDQGKIAFVGSFADLKALASYSRWTS